MNGAESDLPRGLAVLVVEDESLVAMLLEDMLADLGCTVLGPAMALRQAEEILARPDLVVDAAILDVNVGGQPVYPLAERLAGRGVPLVFATGYGETGLSDTWRGSVTLEKPYSQDDVARALGLARRRAAR